MLGEQTRYCPMCHQTLLPDPPASAVCPSCGAIAVPHHSMWPRPLKLWLLAELGRRAGAACTTEQQAWEKLLRETFLSEPSAVQRNGVLITTSTLTLDLLPIATRCARDWEADGAPLAAVDHRTRIAS